jgi:Methyltransferase FkbM domain
VPRHGERSGEEVPGMTVSELLDAAGFERADFVKLDIQGGEAELFAHAEGWARRVGALVAEIHAPLTVDAAAARLAAHGYERLPLPRGRLFEDMLYIRHAERPASG